MQLNRRIIEKYFVLITTVFGLFLIFAIVVEDKPFVAIPPLVLGLVSSWSAYFKQYGNKKMRAYILTIVASVVVVTYGILAENFYNVIAPFALLILMVGLFNIPRLISWITVGIVIVAIYHGVVVRSFDVSGRNYIMKLFLQTMCLLIYQWITYRTITSRIETDREMLEIIDALKQAERSKDEFMANVSHEIRTPLNTICGMSELILREKELDSQVREDAFHIQLAGRKLQSIVSDVLDFSELETGKITLNEGYYNFSSVMNDVLNDAIAQNEEKKLEIIANCDPTIPRSMLGDSEKICRVMYSLINNAIKFTESGCVVINATARRENYGVNLCISIQDTGIGMSTEVKEKLSADFYQVDTQKNRSQGGIGLGLAISRRLVEIMNGFLKVRSQSNIGTEISFVIPQRVEDARPMIAVREKESIILLCYMNEEKYDMVEKRECYANSVETIAKQLGVAYTQCRSIQELKRRVSMRGFSHLLISMVEYQEDCEYFESLAKECHVLLVLERGDEVPGKDFYRIYKPFFSLSVATALNGERLIQRVDGGYCQSNHFIAPQAAVLVVDDNQMNLKVMEGLLRPYEIKVFVAGSGEEALKLLQQKRYDIVFMDHMMPGMDGVETLHNIRSKAGAYYKNLPVIALSANAIAGAREMFVEEGFQDFVAKPVEMSNLERVLKQYIPDDKIINIEREETNHSRVPLSYKQEMVEQKKPANPLSGVIDEETGVIYCGGSRDDYQDILRLYYELGSEKKKTIEQLFNDASWEDYVTEVHALKSTSQSIGAGYLYELAKAQEQAGKDRNLELLFAEHAPMLEEYDAVLLQIAERLNLS